MYVKLAFALISISLSLYGRQAESMSPPPEQPVSSASPAEIPALKPMAGVFIDWKDRVIHATGTGFGSESGDPRVRGMLALRAARADALKKLATVVYGLHTTPVTTLEDLSRPEKLRLKVEGLIQGAQESGEPETLNDGGVRIHLVLPLTGLEKGLALAEPLPRQ